MLDGFNFRKQSVTQEQEVLTPSRSVGRPRIHQGETKTVFIKIPIAWHDEKTAINNSSDEKGYSYSSVTWGAILRRGLNTFLKDNQTKNELEDLRMGFERMQRIIHRYNDEKEALQEEVNRLKK